MGTAIPKLVVKSIGAVLDNYPVDAQLTEEADTVSWSPVASEYRNDPELDD